MPRLRRVEHPRRDARPRAARERTRGARRACRRAAAPRRLLAIAEADLPRRRLGIGEFDRVLGGGLVPGSLVLLGGEPGIGKSTLLLQAAAGLAARRRPAARVLYASGEESAGPGPLRAARLGLLAGAAGQRIQLVAENDVGRIVEAARAERPALLIVDSIQTATVDELDGAAGSVGQVRESTLRLMELAKGDGIAVVLVGHVTKDGTLAGPEDPRAPGRCGAQPRGRRYARASPAAGGEEPLRLDRRGRRVRDGRGRPDGGRRSGRAFLAEHEGRPRAASSRRRWRAAGRSSSRSRRWSPDRLRHAARGRPPASTPTGSRC